LARPQRGQTGEVEIEVTRPVDRDRVAEALRGRGLSLEPKSETVISVEGDAGDIVAELEGWIAASGVPFVPVRQDDRVLLRPPGG
jgi:hypothetical protein